jgi:hypothetical protein
VHLQISCLGQGIERRRLWNEVVVRLRQSHPWFGRSRVQLNGAVKPEHRRVRFPSEPCLEPPCEYLLPERQRFLMSEGYTDERFGVPTTNIPACRLGSPKGGQGESGVGR